ncbi:MAG: hypothetical protein UT05_C0009G0051 [Parcubacteria group bacterium GW2011_GWF2_38_76]|nr:MAG: hypothetical protein UT05_C0009G0051 [Parcubacteria group bacterium GW2011_GWF2_38_76]HBM45492.1 SAM-dependent methyltransferase [Patescibacteria group bacterium]
MLTNNNWKDYELIDSGDGEKLERWGEVVLSRPDPQAFWPKMLPDKEWHTANGIYTRSEGGGGAWKFKEGTPKKWEIKYGDLKFSIKPTPFKHTGLFPEQAINWDWMKDKIKGSGKDVSVLNLFAYTGGATVASSNAGAKVCHVDSSNGIVTWAKENIDLNNKSGEVRWIVDDALKFVDREIKRGVKYDGIIMDPPSYGRGAKGEVWKLEEKLWPLVEKTSRLLSDKPLFFIINSYTTGMSPTVIGNILKTAFKNKGGKIETDELGLKEKNTDRVLPQGVFGRWSI